MLRTLWPHVRAILVVLHLVAIFLMALPAPEGGMNRQVWGEPTVRHEFEVWSERLHLTRPELEDLTWRVGEWWMKIRGAYLTPVRPYLDRTGCMQVWRMFVGANRFPTRYQVQVHEAGAPAETWRTLFERDNPEARWRESVFESERLRNGTDRMAWPHYKAFFDELCAYVSKEAFAEFPNADQARCRSWRSEAPTPEQARAGFVSEGRWAAVDTHQRPAPAVKR